MIDIHSHILWGMDDGSSDRQTSLRMLEIAAKTGTTDIVATPHANGEFHYGVETIEEQIRDLRSAATAPTIHRGCDFHLSYENIEDALANPRKYTIAGTHFLLVEFADVYVSASADRILEQLIHADMFPIITHPERNGILAQKVDELASWVDHGSFIQLTAKSLEGGFGAAPRKAAWKMLSRGIVHFVASDAHDTDYRPPRLDLAFQKLSSNLGAEQAELLVIDNPAVVLRGGDPACVLPAQPAARRSFFSFLRWG